jgi:hypothetical protein
MQSYDGRRRVGSHIIEIVAERAGTPVRFLRALQKFAIKALVAEASCAAFVDAVLPRGAGLNEAHDDAALLGRSTPEINSPPTVAAAEVPGVDVTASRLVPGAHRVVSGQNTAVSSGRASPRGC